MCYRCGKWRDYGHVWKGCKCPKCGQTRDEQHDWDGCKCRICGKIRDEQHDWDGCKCRKCGKVRDQDHHFVFNRKEIDNDYVHVELTVYKCTRCGKEITEREGLGEPQSF